MRGAVLTAILVLLAGGLTACGDDGNAAQERLLQEQGTALEGLRERVERLEYDATSTTSPAATTTTAAPVAEPTPAEVFAAAAPSVVYVEVADGTGSGVVLPGGWVLTNAHVVGREPVVRLVTAVGELAEVPVHSRDWLYDLALVGPLPEEADGLEPLPLGDSAGVRVGDAVYLVGFPGEVEADPVATMTAGILSRRRVHACLDAAFLQVDALIAGGQSGGALLDASGSLIGLSGLGGFSESNFGLVHAAEDVERVLGPLWQGDPPESAGSRQLEVETRYTDSAAVLVAVTEASPLVSVRVTAASGADVWLSLDTVDGFVPTPAQADDEVDYLFGDAPAAEGGDLFYADAHLEGRAEQLEVRLLPGRYVVSAGFWSMDDRETLTFESSHPLVPLVDVEGAGEPLVLGDAPVGVIDHYYDIDTFRLALREGQQVRIQVDALGDPVVSVYRDDVLLASNDDARTGLYGLGASVSLVAPEDGEYDVGVAMVSGVPAGYRVHVLPGDSEACR